MVVTPLPPTRCLFDVVYPKNNDHLFRPLINRLDTSRELRPVDVPLPVGTSSESLYPSLKGGIPCKYNSQCRKFDVTLFTPFYKTLYDLFTWTTTG